MNGKFLWNDGWSFLVTPVGTSYEQEEKKAFITFEGVYMDSTVYINGQKAGEWKYEKPCKCLNIILS